MFQSRLLYIFVSRLLSLFNQIIILQFLVQYLKWLTSQIKRQMLITFIKSHNMIFYRFCKVQDSFEKLKK